MIDDPIVDEIHRIRAQMLDQYDGDLRALMKDAQRRTEEAARAGRPVMAPPEVREDQVSAESVKKAG